MSVSSLGTLWIKLVVIISFVSVAGSASDTSGFVKTKLGHYVDWDLTMFGLILLQGLDLEV